MNPDGLLANLNPSQRAAVSSFADTLAILAGPGSGKTHTLTSRTAWLLEQGLQPWNIIVATFTVKAAREMKERIGRLIGNGMESKLILGTFHSIARRYLTHYGHLINIRKDFGIADSSDSLAIIKRIIKRHEFIIHPKIVRSRISGRKARGDGNTDREARKPATKSVETQEFEMCYTEYEAALKRSNLLDYDDLLLRCVDLLRSHPSCVSNVEAVLIDEFQDTNLVQFDLMRLFGAHRKRITIVGDPDQSIYGFRAAETKNYKRMLFQYPDTVTIALEENYRSSGAILLTALSVIEQDSSRVSKSLLPTHTVGTRPVLRKLSGAHKEAEWITTEIQRCIGMTGDLLDLNDFAILLRSASLSRLIEGSLGKAGIAYRMVGGLRFYDRVEVKTILDYLRVINQLDNNDALVRIINTPSRRVGEVTIRTLLEEADHAKITLWSLILGVVQGKRTARTNLPKQTVQGLSSFVNIILTARNKLSDASTQGISNADLIDFVLKKTCFEDWLEIHHDDVDKGRWANVQELITQAEEFQDLISSGYEDESLPEVEGVQQAGGSDPLSRFLANVALASDVKKDDGDGVATAQVTISTIHAAKGLEWPIVFIPATYEGSIPHSRAEDSDEERRLLYVAMTRAKALLYMSYPLRNSQGEQTTISPFLAPPSLSPLLDQRGPSLCSRTVQSLSQILRRPLPCANSTFESSARLESLEDNLFPVEGEEDGHGSESRWTAGPRNSAHAMGERAPKRQRVEVLSSGAIVEQTSKGNWNGTHSTIMEQVSSLKAGFVSAGVHLQALAEHSSNEIPKTSHSLNSNARSKPMMKDLQGQGTLMGFLGKPESQTLSRPLHNIKEFEGSRNYIPISHSNVSSRSASRPSTSLSSNTMAGISPFLADHRINAAPSAIRPRQTTQEQPQKRNDYVFLSSSPPRPKKPKVGADAPTESPAGLSTKPPLLHLIRPAKIMHTTSMEILQKPNSAIKTLGVKRSMSGWSSRKGGPFVPPTMKPKF